MNEENTQKLRDEFPVLFGPNEWRPEGFLRGFGFECQDGWYDLVREFALKCKKHNLANPDKPIVALIVKEKLGGLRIQGLTNMNDERYEWLRQVESKSYKVCDQCGQPGTLMKTEGGYLLATRCENHARSYHDEPMAPWNTEFLNGDS